MGTWTRASVCASLLTLLLAVVPTTSIASASAKSSVTASSVVKTARYAVVAVANLTDQAGLPLDFTLTVDQNGVSKPFFFWLKNVGELGVKAVTLSQTLNAQKQASVALTSCSTAWDVLLDTCNGVSTTLTTGVGSGTHVADVGISLTSGGSIHVRASVVPDKKNFTISDSVSVSVTKAQSAPIP